MYIIVYTYTYISIHAFRWYTYKYAWYIWIFVPSQQADLLHFAGSFGAFWGWLGYRMDLFRNYEKMDQAHWWLKLATREIQSRGISSLGFQKPTVELEMTPWAESLLENHSLFLPSILNTCRGCTLPETKCLHLKRCHSQKGNDRLPTIHFQVLLLMATRNPIPNHLTCRRNPVFSRDSHHINLWSPDFCNSLGAPRFNVPCWWCTVRRMTSSHWEMVWRSMKHVRILWNLYG